MNISVSAGRRLCCPAGREPVWMWGGPPTGDYDSESTRATPLAWPKLKQWLPRSFYDRCHEFAFAHWESSGLLGIDPLWDPETYLDPVKKGNDYEIGAQLHPYKGRHAPGHSIVPNLMLYEAVAQMDNVFGRNPEFAAAPHHPEKGFPLVERGWPKGQPNNVCARLEITRGSLSASPGTEMYPFNPNRKFRHPEGWVNYNATWNVALAYLEWDKERRSGL